MNDDFEAKFKDIIDNNDFSEITDPVSEIAMQEVVEVMEAISSTSLHISQLIYDAFHNKELSFPERGLNVFRALHLLSEEFNAIMFEENENEDEDEEDDE